MAGRSKGSGDFAMTLPRLSGFTGQMAQVMPGAVSSTPNLPAA